MPSAWVIGSLVIQSSLVILVISLIVGFLFFTFIISSHSKVETKKRIDEISSLFTAFVISLWIGKIVINFSVFLADPRAIVAYPSDSKAFYFAVLATILYAKYRIITSTFHMWSVLFSFIVIFLSSSLIYEFIQILWGDKVQTWGYLGLLVMLLTIVILLQEKIKTDRIACIILVGWSIGKWALSVFSTTFVFHFYLHSSFYIIMFICSIGLIMNRKRLNR
ncbi:hypothetical protein [Priestia taiwanensis]|uniref:Uncharacterized protein n=1 Tax=Priestia taiwanensis TaxID=1347902 RepID=A0A917AYZ9_9BACI|nr:hypothetical protein [Priestia taiwanensis]MBM7365058.1 magnesium-transporting ATPase (P-type) [Priestia taiwanensis]GGE83765.1 hypothetical protein GCM10007140_36580 [Priestia taiwanensis]